MILVFDAWQSDRPVRTREQAGALSEVFTPGAAKPPTTTSSGCATLRRRHRGRTAGGAGGHLRRRGQTGVLARGATRLPSRELIEKSSACARPPAIVRREVPVNPPCGTLPEDVRQKLERMRRGE